MPSFINVSLPKKALRSLERCAVGLYYLLFDVKYLKFLLVIIVYKMASNVYNVSECSELMVKIQKFSSIMENKSNDMKEGVYKELYDCLKELYETKLIIKVDTYAKKTQRNTNGRVRHTQQQYRILASQYPDKYAICPICETGMLKENIKLHYQTTQKCKDIYYTKRGVEMCQECIDPQIKELITEIYGEPVPALPQELIDAGNNAPNYGGMNQLAH